MLLELINSTLTKQPLDLTVYEDATEADWQYCFDMALEQGVLAITFPAISSLPKELRPYFALWSKWMVYTADVAKKSQYKHEVVKKIGSWLIEDGLSTTILKGFSLAAIYPNPHLREFSDIDIFSGKDYEAVNKCFAKHSVIVDSIDGHHAYLKVDGISVEHHFAFSNTKVKNGLVGPEESLQSSIVKNQQTSNLKGIYYPNPLFTALFVGWHAYEHFLQEKIQLRHLIDWVLSLKQLNKTEAGIVSEVKGNTKWGQFTDILTAIAMHQLKMPAEWFPKEELETANIVDSKREQKVWNDILHAPHTPKSKSSNWRRIYIAKRMLKNSWKYKEYSNISASKLLMIEFVELVRGRSQITNP